MTNSQVKQAIDETIGNEPMLSEAFIEKVLIKKKPKKSFGWLQPVIVVACVFLVAFSLYMLPNEQQSTSDVQVDAPLLTEHQLATVTTFYEAIKNQDIEAFTSVSDADGYRLFVDYKHFDFTRPLEMIKTVDSGEQMTLFVKLVAEDTVFLNKLIYTKETHTISLPESQSLTYYREATFPEKIELNYISSFIGFSEGLDISDYKDYVEPIRLDNGSVVRHVQKDRFKRMILQTKDGQMINISDYFEVESYNFSIHKNDVFLYSKKTTEALLLHEHSNGDYQLITGKVDFDNNVKTYYENKTATPFILFDSIYPKIAINESGNIIEAYIKEDANLNMPSEFYEIETNGRDEIYIVYKEDTFEKSAAYEFDADLNLIHKEYSLKAEAHHLDSVMLRNRYDDRIYYLFSEGELLYRADSRLFIERPKSADEKPLSGELIENTYTNIKISTKGNQYFITGDDGFSLTLKRIGERLLVDQEGNEYITPIYFR